MEQPLLPTFCKVLGTTGATIGAVNPSGSLGEQLLSVLVLFDHPFDVTACDEALFSLAIQDWGQLEVLFVMPDCGEGFARDMEQVVRAHPWASTVRLKMVSVLTCVGRHLLANLINAAIPHAVGRYVAFLQHQQLIYHHAYPTLIGRLLETDAPIAFGALRQATHKHGARHWYVDEKAPQSPLASRLDLPMAGRAALHSFVLDTTRLQRDYLLVSSADSDFAVFIFLLRLCLHPQADFTLRDTPIGESRVPPSTSTPTPASLDRLLACLEDGTLHVRDKAFPLTALLADAVRGGSHRRTLDATLHKLQSRA
jgi:hypothetical protein